MTPQEKEKIENIFCVLTKNIDYVGISETSINYANQINRVSIGLNKWSERVPTEYTKVKLFGIELWDKVVKKAHSKDIVYLYSSIDGYSYNTHVDVEMFDELHAKIKAEKEAKFNEVLKNMCNNGDTKEEESNQAE